jgi:hypothetical protein
MVLMTWMFVPTLLLLQYSRTRARTAYFDNLEYLGSQLLITPLIQTSKDDKIAASSLS